MSGECDAAIAGGVNLLLDPTVSINHSRALMLAPDGRCKAFSADADGMGRSEGCGLILLKRFEDAVRDGDPVLALIRGSAVNQDGRTSRLTAPSGQAQERVIRKALQRAQVKPEEIGYIEAHGTGTPLGDPIEAEALMSVFRGVTRPVTLGSVKTNIGHCESAAGVAGLIKTVLAFNNDLLPGHLHCGKLNPSIDWSHAPLRINRSNEAWPPGQIPRIAGVSSFGFGGTNAHVIVEEAPAPAEPAHGPEHVYILPLSAKTETALQTLARTYVTFLERPQRDISEICYTASCGRDHYPHRLIVSGTDTTALRDGLIAWLAGSGKTRKDSPLLRTTTLNGSGGLATAYLRGDDVDWAGLYGSCRPRRIVLPGHPFERRRHFVEASAPISGESGLYEIQWERTAAPGSASLRGHWLLVADEAGWAESLAAAMERFGARVSIVWPESEYDWPGIFAHYAGGRPAVFEGIVDARCVAPLQGGADETDLPRSIFERSQALAALARALHALRADARLWVLTRDAVAAVPGDRVDGIRSAPLWGLSRTVSLELDVRCGVIDLPGDLSSLDSSRTSLHAVCGVLSGKGPDNQYAVRAGEIWTARLRPKNTRRLRNIEIVPDAAYLISGGFGSLGREIGRWLVARGARQLWLLSRTGASTEAAAAYLSELAKSGVQIRVAALDVSRDELVSAQIQEWLASGAQLRGVIHAAGLNAEAALNSDQQALQPVLDAKAGGAWVLHRATAAQSLDFFVLCSSIASVWGGQRQAAYSAANAFLDALAHHRRNRGMAALSINWGPLLGSTMMHSEAVKRIEAAGIHPQPLASATDRLAEMLEDGSPQILCAKVIWERFIPLYTSRCPIRFFDGLAGRRAPEASAESRNGVAKEVIANGSASDFDSWITVHLAEALGIQPDRLDRNAPLTTLGVDSLIAVEIRNRIRDYRGVDIALADLLGGISLNQLASHPMIRVNVHTMAAGAGPLLSGEI